MRLSVDAGARRARRSRWNGLQRLAAGSLWNVVLLCHAGCFFVQADLNPFRTRPEELVERKLEGSGKDKVLLVDVSHLIVSTERPGLLGTAPPSVLARVREELKRASEDERVRAVVLRVNSPGGTVTASDTLYHEIRDFRARTGRPVIAHLLDVGTSGAYYVALAADEIVASPTTVTGSVGVLLAGLNFSGLLDKLGIKNQTLKSGVLKDAGSPLRPMTPADEAVLQGILTAMHERFLAIVRERRPGLAPGALEKIRDGRVVHADEALVLGLVDRIGYLEDAIERAKQQANLSEATIVAYRRPMQYAENIYSTSRAPLPLLVQVFPLELGAFSSGPQFWYLWVPEGTGSPGLALTP
ncbi:MAG: signal peptide peptidase SppA [Candidatus Binatia bacterium]|nr:MAG: signal peptide peptidase SppA [Candidatus Binatia bacterium]